jgi:hypothetical protein
LSHALILFCSSLFFRLGLLLFAWNQPQTWYSPNSCVARITDFTPFCIAKARHQGPVRQRRYSQFENDENGMVILWVLGPAYTLGF